MLEYFEVKHTTFNLLSNGKKDGRAALGRAGQGRAGQGREEQGREGKEGESESERMRKDWLLKVKD